MLAILTDNDKILQRKSIETLLKDKLVRQSLNDQDELKK